MDSDFGHWLAGFIDGEGCFTARITKHGQVQVFMTIGLRGDDRAILEECQRQTGLGKVYDVNSPSLQRWSAQSKWVVYRKVECQELVKLLQTYPLRAKKARDFAIWAEIVRLHAQWERKGRARSARYDTAPFKVLMDALQKERTY